MIISASIVISGFLLWNLTQKIAKDTQKSVNNSVQDVATPPEESTAKPQRRLLKKSKYRIALYGDSMIDTMGQMQYLNEVLQETYLQTTFELYNYGIGSQNIEQGIARFYDEFHYQDRTYPSISQIGVDVIILGSFSYNPFIPHDPAKHKELLTQLVSKAKKTHAKVYLMAEIAPLQYGFGYGPKGVNWDEQTSEEHALKIIAQLNNVYTVAKEQNIPVIDVYKSTKTNDPFGNQRYTNPDDGIHPSEEGHAITADSIVKSVRFE